MAGVIIITIEGSTPKELAHNYQIINEQMRQQDLFQNVSNGNPMIYYSAIPAISARVLNGIFKMLKAPNVAKVIKSIKYSTNLLKA